MVRSAPIVEADELAALIDAHDVVVVDCRFSLADPGAGRAAFAGGHVPSALYAHLDDDLAGPVTDDSGRHPLPTAEAFATRLTDWGISPATQVVAYDDAGGAIASRFWWLLRWLGHEPVAVLNGGLTAWEAAGHPLESGTAASSTRATQAYPAVPNQRMVISTADLLGTSIGESLCLADARDAQRFRGEVEPLDSVAGHVPGAVNLPFSSLLGADGRLLPATELREAWDRAADGTAAEARVAMCGSGVTACHLALAAVVAGLPMPRLYVGSWSEWIRDPARPVAAGTR